MKGITNRRGLKALTASLALGLGMTACSRDYVVGYLYATNAKANPGLLTGYSIDYETGRLTQLADSPIPAGGSNPVTIIASPNGKNLYVLDHDTSTVVEYDIGTDGKIYPENTYNVVQGDNVTGTFPTAATIDPAGAFLYVVFTYQDGYTTVRPGPGGLAVFPINSDGSLQAAVTNASVGGASCSNLLPYFPLGDNPIGIVVSPSVASGRPAADSALNYVNIIDQEGASTGSPFGVLLSFSVGTLATAAHPCAAVPTLTVPVAIAQLSGTFSNGVAAGTTPSAITESQSGAFLYVTDSTANMVYTFSVGNGVPGSLPSSQVATGLGPDAVTIDPRGKFAYVANYGSSTLSAYTISSTSGALTPNGANIAVETGPNCVTIDPALGIYLYTSNNENNTISAEQLNPTTGALVQVQGTPYSSQMLPTCLVAVANGAHTTEIVQ